MHACMCPALTVSGGTSADIFGGGSEENICLNQSNGNAMAPYGELRSQLINGDLGRYRAIFVKEVAYAQWFIC